MRYVWMTAKVWWMKEWAKIDQAGRNRLLVLLSVTSYLVLMNAVYELATISHKLAVIVACAGWFVYFAMALVSDIQRLKPNNPTPLPKRTGYLRIPYEGLHEFLKLPHHLQIVRIKGDDPVSLESRSFVIYVSGPFAPEIDDNNGVSPLSLHYEYQEEPEFDHRLVLAKIEGLDT